MFYLNGHTRVLHFENREIETVEDICRELEAILEKSATSYQTWYELFVSPDDGEYWYFSNKKRDYAISVKWFDRK